MKGIILAAGKGTRLYPMTYPVPKPLLPVYDKPLIYYPLSVLIQLGVTEVIIIVPPDYQDLFESLLSDGSQLGISIKYKIQQFPRGIADAFIVGEEFIGDDPVILMLGDNIFFNNEIEVSVLEPYMNHLADRPDCAMVLGHRVRDPWRFGVVEFGPDGKAISIEEKPIEPKSDFIIPGFYYYPNDVVKKAKEVAPSARGELEITSINQSYLEEDRLYVERLPDGSHWFDTGTSDSLLEAANAIRNHQFNNDYIGCIEVEAEAVHLITLSEVKELGSVLKSTNYGAYLLDYAYKHDI